VNDLELGFAFLVAQSTGSLLTIFWFTVIFEFPRYLLPFAAAGLFLREREVFAPGEGYSAPQGESVSVMLVGHNEQDALEACVRSLREQSFAEFDIVVVSDGSSDRMTEVARRLVRDGLITQVMTTDLRGGKSSGINLAWNSVRGDIVINVDCDCSFDRYAIEHLLSEFEDPNVGIVCGDVAPRNGDASLIAQFQEIEYLQSISVGKRIGNATDQVVCASGAFSAFRRRALEQVGGFDVGGGEDLDITMRLRNAGWKSVFAPHSICYTDVPTSAFALIRQRLRWERDSVWIRYRKHRALLNPFRHDFRPLETFHQWDFLVFSVAGAFVFPGYLLWLAATYGSFTPAILIALQLGLLTVDAAILAVSAWITRRPVFLRHVLFLPAYSLFMTYVMRPVRLIAYVDEWCFSGSHRDNYTPHKVRAQRAW
jgi:cellulose synthase/poly-beta-1,6-N-acetylglucosamine synthase-like glycosyltransferase